MKIGNRSIFRFFLERFVPAATGGYTSYQDQPDIVFWGHTIIYMWLFVVPIILTMVSKSSISPFLHPSITALIWLIIKSINYYFNRQFDKQTEAQTDTLDPITENLATSDENPPPYGISHAIWRIREQITDFQDVDIDTMVDNLIQQGYNANDLFYFYDVYQRGLLNITNNEIVPENHAPTVPTTIHFCCCSYVITWTRKDLERWFDRPMSFIECIFSPVAAFFVGIMAFYSTPYVSFPFNTTLFLSSASSQFALLKAPNPDSFSSIYQDPLTPYSRAFHFVFFQLLFTLSAYLLNDEKIQQAIITVFEMDIRLELIIDIIHQALRFIILIFPFLNAFGIIGSLKVSWFFLLEMIQMIFFGASGAVTFYSANLSFIVSICSAAILTFCHCIFSTNILIQRLIVALSFLFGTLLSSFSYLPLITKKIFEKQEYVTAKNVQHFKRFGISLLITLVKTFFVFVLMIFDFCGSELFLSIVSAFLITSGIIHHIMIPNLMSRYPFKIWSFPFFKNSPQVQKYLKIVDNFERYFLVPVTLASIFRISEGKKFGFNSWVESFFFVIMITYVSTMAHRHLSRLCLVLAISSMSKKQFDFVLFHTYFYLLVIWKLSEFLEKLHYINTYSSFHSVTSQIQFICLITMYANVQYTMLAVALSCLLTSPLVPLFGSAMFLPSFSRPTAFWVERIQIENHENSTGDSQFYKFINGSLAESLAKMVNKGYFPTLVENNFYLICDDYFNAIIHIIDAGLDYIVFQLRGLEVREQTLCHRNELNVVRNGLDNLEDPRVFLIANVLTKFTSVLWKIVDAFFVCFGLPKVLSRRKLSFVRSSSWSTWLEDLPILSYSVSANNIDQIFPDRESQLKIFINLARVLTCVLKENDEIEVPRGFDFPLPNEEIGEWIHYHEKTEMTPVIMSVTKVMVDAMMNSESSASFGWKLFQYFNGNDLKLSSFSWIPSIIEPKLLDSFRTSVSLAVADVAYTLPDEIEELSTFINLKIGNCHMMPENDPRWADLIDKNATELETLRQFNDPNGVLVKYMMFTLREQPFKIIKLNDENVRGIWAEQVIETVFMESDDRERGSVQFDMFTLRNIISQSANPPVGYPEIICPVTFSYA
ncbi:hypothetical protein TRFO_11476 [Tritrichomonas foetus]|uniref:Pecanex C-terminal domain-containing protein n=1 Tax=Tritrichomonas foetus TaxID=1144522 RepID=A0A1J4J8G9_9EUKA|nr:hypothetical protein TRFO_11476 [Tritrichomonas foetus]|eukprot:OHS93987.1 hypothetical protein TRFO_11476 [Tritrichomonas foetus]